MHCFLVHSMIQKQKMEFPLLLFIIVLQDFEPQDVTQLDRVCLPEAHKC